MFESSRPKDQTFVTIKNGVRQGVRLRHVAVVGLVAWESVPQGGRTPVVGVLAVCHDVTWYRDRVLSSAFGFIVSASDWMGNGKVGLPDQAVLYQSSTDWQIVDSKLWSVFVWVGDCVVASRDLFGNYPSDILKHLLLAMAPIHTWATISPIVFSGQDRQPRLMAISMQTQSAWSHGFACSAPLWRTSVSPTICR